MRLASSTRALPTWDNEAGFFNTGLNDTGVSDHVRGNCMTLIIVWGRYLKDDIL